jgi:coenzyme Q-binding protein COQ10
MPSFETSRRVRHTAEQMFALVSDVEAYPKFLPLCTGLRVRHRSDEGETRIFVADMQVGYKAIRETFTTKVVCERSDLRILVKYIDGPFKYLENSWSFRDVGEGDCLVAFSITYEFRSRMLAVLMGGMFDMAFHRFSEAFERRADEVYGRRSIQGSAAPRA